MRRILCVSLLLAVMVSVSWAAPLDNMDNYLAKKDASYKWRIIDKEMATPLVGHIEMVLTSQTWRDLKWNHRVTIYYPKNMENVHHAFLLISGGDWNDEREKEREAKLREERKEREARKAAGQPESKPKQSMEFDEGTMASMLVNKIRMPTIVLNNVPLQPIFDGKTEDAIISYTFEKFVETGEPDWPLLLPMTKSAVRCMDAVQELAKKEWKTQIQGFIVAGGSKRGWTTWLTASMDKRVSACAPAVIDVLNMSVQMKHQLATWGKYSEMINDYTMRGIQDKMDTPHGKELLKIVDPYSYQQRAKMPKMLIFGTNDRYWPLDACNIYWNDLVGEKYLLYIPNKGHACIDIPRLLSNCGAMTMLGAGRVTFPKYTWDIKTSEKGLTLNVGVEKAPKQMVIWRTEAPTRDFREAKWRSEPMKEADGGFTFDVPMPETGYAAAFGEALFDLGNANQVYLSTNVKIIGKDLKDSK